jgi:hypothetical protein
MGTSVPGPRSAIGLPSHSAPPLASRLVSSLSPSQFSWKVLGNLSKVFPFTAPGSRHWCPGPGAPPRPTEQPAVLGRRGFREGLGLGGQKIRRWLAPPRPTGPPRSPSLAAGAAASQSLPVVRAPWNPDLLSFSAHWFPSVIQPASHYRVAAATGTWCFAFRGKCGSPPQRSLRWGSTGEHRPRASCRTLGGLEWLEVRKDLEGCGAYTLGLAGDRRKAGWAPLGADRWTPTAREPPRCVLAAQTNFGAQSGRP